MAIQESNETKFFAWLKSKVILAQCQEMQKTKGAISVILMQKKVIKRPLFLMDDADEVANIISKVAPCFVSSKTKTLAVQIMPEGCRVPFSYEALRGISKTAFVRPFAKWHYDCTYFQTRKPYESMYRVANTFLGILRANGLVKS